MNISVILCTYNRCQSLVKALESIALSALPEAVEWEVLVVDNNSTDQTRQVTEEFCSRYPGRFHYRFEPQQGKSHALNTGIREARGEILAFVDDDVTVEPTWLSNLTSALRDNTWAGAGGRIYLEKGFTPPSWLALDGPYAMGGVLVMFDLGNTPGKLEESPYGTNMAFRKEIFKKYGGFRADLGPRPGSEIRNEDTEFCRRIMDAGEQLRYEPSAIVYHSVPTKRIHKQYFLAWWFNYGRALALEFAKKPGILGIPRSYFSIVKAGATILVIFVPRWLLALNPKRRFYYKVLVWRTAGAIVEFYRRALGKETTAGQCLTSGA